MNTKQKVVSVICMCMSILLTFNASATENDMSEIAGIWLTEEDDAKVEVFQKGGRIYGNIIWSKKIESGEESGFDVNNPDEELRERKIIGLQILSDFEKTGDTKWENGKIYDPESGNTYSCVIKLDRKKQTLKVRGYMGIALIGRTTTWKRFTE